MELSRAVTANQSPARITSGSRRDVGGAWLFAIAWNAISSPMLFFLPEELAKKNWPALLGLLFPLVGAWLIYRAVYKTLQWHRFGTLTLTLQPSPGVIGATMTASVDLPERFRANQPFTVTINCIHRYVSGSSKDRTTWEKSLWQNETTARVEPGLRGTRLSFRFTVPAGLPPTTPHSDDHHYWKVHLRADIPGIDLDHGFEIPMVDTGEIGMTSPLASFESAAETQPPPVPLRVVEISRNGDALALYYPPLRSLGMSIAVIIFGAIFLGSAAFIHAVAGHGALFWLFSGSIILIFALVGVLLLLLGLYSLVNSLHVELSPRGVLSTRSVFGIAFTRYAALADIVKIESRITSQTNGGNEFRVRYTLYAHLRDGNKLPVGDDIPGPRLAEHLRGVILQALNLK